MKKRTRILPLVFSVLLPLVFVTASARARSNPNPAALVPGEIHGQIRWKKDMGLIPIGPGKILASNAACSAFFIWGVVLAGDNKGRFVSPPSTSPPKEREGYYVCDYYMQVPLDTDVTVLAGMGDVGLLPRKNRDPYFLTDPWIGGTNSRPPAGWERDFDKYFFTKIPPGSMTIFYRFEIIYRDSIDYSPNPERPTSSGEKPPSPLLPTTNFAGAWRAKFGDRLMELILQQTGAQVTGELRGFSYRVFIREGIVDGNTLRFQVMRVENPSRPDLTIPMGTGQLVMDESGKSFTGNVLGTATSGTLIAR